jgi:alpha-1,3-rhamnosyl/mannosyltransferase
MYPQLYPFSARVFYDRLYAWSARHATLVITATEAAKHDIARCYGVPLSRIRVVPLGIEDIFRPRRGDSRVEEARKRYLGSEAPYFLFVGKLSARRNAPRLLEAFAELKRRKALPHKLLLIGPNSRKLELSTLAAKFGIAEEVVHHQYVSDEDLSSLYSAAELFVMPSSFEAVSLTVMEAQASGTPVISIDTPGMREVTGGAALLMPTADVPRIVEAISRLGEDTAFRQELSERGLDHARQFSWQRCSSETLHILEEAALLPRASVYRSAA